MHKCIINNSTTKRRTTMYHCFCSACVWEKKVILRNFGIFLFILLAAQRILFWLGKMLKFLKKKKKIHSYFLVIYGMSKETLKALKEFFIFFFWQHEKKSSHLLLSFCLPLETLLTIWIWLKVHVYLFLFKWQKYKNSQWIRDTVNDGKKVSVILFS